MAAGNGTGVNISMAECMKELRAFHQVLENVESTNRSLLNKLETRQRHPMVFEENRKKVADLSVRGDQLVQNLEDRDRDLHNLTETVSVLCGKVDGLINDFSSMKDTSRQKRRKQPVTASQPPDRHVSKGRHSSATPETSHRGKHTFDGRHSSDTRQTLHSDYNMNKRKQTEKTERRDVSENPVTVNSRGYKRRVTDDRTDNRLKAGDQPNIGTLPRTVTLMKQGTVNIEPGQSARGDNSKASLALARKQGGKAESGLASLLSTETSKMPGLDHSDGTTMDGIGNSGFIADFVFEKWYSYAETQKDIGSVSGLARGKGPDTVLCLDTSASMEGEPFQNMMEFAMAFVTGVSLIEIEENIAVTTIGEDTKVWIHMTSDFAAVKTTLRQINALGARGRSPLAGGLLVALAGCLGNGKHVPVGDVTVSPRIVLISDGRGTPDHIKAGPDQMEEHNTDLAAKLIVDANLKSVSENLKRRHNKVYCIPVGDADQIVLDKISQTTSGKVFLPTQLSRFLRWMDKTIAAAFLVARVIAAIGYILPGDGMRFMFESRHQEASPEDTADVLELAEIFIGELPDQLITFERDEQLPALGTRVRRGLNWKYQDQDSKGVGTVCSHGKDGNVWVEWDNGHRYSYDYKNEANYVIAANEPRVLKSDELIATGCRVTRGDTWPYGNEDGGPGSVGVVVRVYLHGSVIVRWANKAFSNLKYGSDGEFEVKICTGELSTLPARQEDRSVPHSDTLYIESVLPSTGEMNRRNTLYQQ